MWIEKFRKSGSKFFVAIMVLIAFNFLIFYETFPPSYAYAEQTDMGLKNLEQGLEFYNKGEWEKAINSLRMSVDELEDRDKLWEAYFYLGYCYYILGKGEKSEKEFRNMLELKKSKEELKREYKFKPEALKYDADKIYSPLDTNIFSPKLADLYNKIRLEIIEEAKKEIEEEIRVTEEKEKWEMEEALVQLPSSDEKELPIYKKWWFWVIVVALIGGGIAMAGGGGGNGGGDTGDVPVTW